MAAGAVARLRDLTSAEALQLVALLRDGDAGVQRAATTALVVHGPFSVEMTAPLLASLYDDVSRGPEIRFLAHYLGGGDQNVGVLLHWLGEYTEGPTDVGDLDVDGGRRALQVFREAWPTTTNTPRVRRDLVAKLQSIVVATSWTERDTELLSDFAAELAAAGHGAAAGTLERAMERRDVGSVVPWVVGAGGAHAVFWVLLVVAYPRSTWVQTYFFWNGRVRRFAGLGYVGFLLAWTPPLRRLLFSPFKQALVADARVAELDRGTYFPDVLVTLPNGKRRWLEKEVKRIEGQIVLSGKAGSGKTVYLRHLMADYGRLVVYLLASRCDKGVLCAIQQKLEGPAGDVDYLQRLIYAGVLDVVIDGLNEVSAGTRAHVTMFAESFARGNLLIATQRIRWKPPERSRGYELEGLTESQIGSFLSSRFEVVRTEDGMTKDEYAAVCTGYLKRALKGQTGSGEDGVPRSVLSNPMDLTVVAQMLAVRREPNLFELQAEYLRLVVGKFGREAPGAVKFRAAEFAEEVYRMRRTGEWIVEGNGFREELECMGDYRMVVPYRTGEAGEGGGRWVFRHEKIMDFFVVRALLGGASERVGEHFGDPRFRGVYMELGRYLSRKEAQGLRDKLVAYAAETGDHAVSDDVVRIVNARGRAEAGSPAAVAEMDAQAENEG